MTIKELATKIFLTIMFFGILAGISAILIAAIFYHNFIPLIAVLLFFTLISVGSIIWTGIKLIWDL